MASNRSTCREAGGIVGNTIVFHQVCPGFYSQPEMVEVDGSFPDHLLVWWFSVQNLNKLQWYTLLSYTTWHHITYTMC